MPLLLALFALIVSPLTAESSDRAPYEKGEADLQHATFGDSRNYPCVLDTKCHWTKGPHPIVTEVKVDYYGALGEQVLWIHQVYSAEKLTSCEEAARNFPHPSFTRCEGPIVTPAALVDAPLFPMN